MSEYQYYEWQTIDRVLSPGEQAEVNRLSSHIDVSPGKAVVTYQWSNFRHDPKEVLLKYFDAFLYYANWGSVRLMFRFPKGSLDEAELAAYWDGEQVSLETIGEYQVLDIDINPEDSNWENVGNIDLSDFISLRADLLEGDYRLLYLTWLNEMVEYADSDDEEDDETEEGNGDEIHAVEPPIPPGMNKLSPALRSIIDILDLNPFLVQAAAEDSPDLHNPLAVNYRELITHLTRQECDDYLTRLAEGEVGAGIALRKHLGKFLTPNRPQQPDGKRPLEELEKRAKQLEEMEAKRAAKEAREKHIAAMNALAGQESQIWQKVDQLLENGSQIASVYNEATGLLEKLQDLATYKNAQDHFRDRINWLAEKYASRPSLMKRWKQHGWI